MLFDTGKILFVPTGWMTAVDVARCGRGDMYVDEEEVTNVATDTS